MKLGFSVPKLDKWLNLSKLKQEHMSSVKI